MKKTNNEIVLSSDFKPFQLQIDKFKKINKDTVFDYDDPKGNKEARSHVFKLRTTKKPINDAHEKAKADILKKGREIDSYKNSLISQIDEMIDVHAEPLRIAKEKQEKKEAEEKEAKRLEEEAEALRVKIEICHESAIMLNDVFDQNKAMEKIKAEQQAKQDELDRIAKEQRLEKERLEREEQIKKEAAEQAKLEAENERLEAERKLEEEKNRRIREAEQAEEKRLADIQAEKDRAEEAKRQAEKEKQDAIDKLKREQAEKEHAEIKKKAALEAEEARLKAIADKKAANRRHQKSVNNKIVKFLAKWDIDENTSKEIVKAIVKNEIPELTVNY